MESLFDTDRPRVKTLLRHVLFVGYLAAITLINQIYIGNLTIYQDSWVQDREAMHEAILHNHPPKGVKSWAEVGSNGTNIRLLVVWGAEVFSRVSGVSVFRTYKYLETTSLFLFLAVLFFFLRSVQGESAALLGVSYVGVLLPLTCLFHNFHPWDKPSLVAWTFLLWLLKRNHVLLFAALVPFAVMIKYDIVPLPALYFFIHAHRADWKRPALITLGLGAISFGTYALLRFLIPGGFEASSVAFIVNENLVAIRDYKVTYPPLLAFAVPLLLGLIGWRTSDRFARACYAFSSVIGGILFLQSNFQEVRAEMPLLLLILPCALSGLRRLLLKPGPGPAG